MASFGEDDFTAKYRQGEEPEKTRLIGYEIEVKRDECDEDWFGDFECNGIAGSGYDGDDIEVVTHPFSINMLGLQHENICPLFSTLELLNDHHCVPCRGGGTHVNVSKLDSDYKYTYDNLLWIQTAFLPQMEKVFGRTTSWAKSPASLCQDKGLRNKTKERFANAKYMKKHFEIFFFGDTEITKNFSRQYNKALQIVDKGNRYEFRGGKSSVDKMEMLAWGQFCKNIVEKASKPSIKGIKFKDFLVGDYIEEYVKGFEGNDKRELKEKELNQTINSVQKLTITNGNRIL